MPDEEYQQLRQNLGDDLLNENPAGDVRNMAKHLLQSIGVDAKNRQNLAVKLIFEMLPSDKQAAFLKKQLQNGERDVYIKIKSFPEPVSNSSPTAADQRNSMITEDRGIISLFEKRINATRTIPDLSQSAAEQRLKAKIETKSDGEIQNMITKLGQLIKKLRTIAILVGTIDNKGTFKRNRANAEILNQDDREQCGSMRKVLVSLGDELNGLLSQLPVELRRRELARMQARQQDIPSDTQHIMFIAKYVINTEESKSNIEKANNSISHSEYQDKVKARIKKLLVDLQNILDSLL